MTTTPSLIAYLARKSDATVRATGQTVQLPADQKQGQIKKNEVLLIINSRIEPSEVRETISLAKGRNSSLNVIYTAVPLFLSDQTTSSEVDYDFVDKLQRGRNILDSIEYQAKELGVDVSTSFVWSESPKDVAAEYGNSVVFVLDKTA